MPMVNAYDNNEYGFSITPPSMWSLIEDTGVPTVVVGFGKTESTASINVAVVEISATLSEVSESIKDYLSDYFDDFSLVYETRRFIGGLECYEIEYTCTQLGFKLKNRQVVFMENEKEFVITYQALESEYSDYLSDAENSISSFRVIADSSNISSDKTMLIIGVIVASVILLTLPLAIFFLRKKQKPESPIESIDSTYDVPTIKFDTIEVRHAKSCRHCGTEINRDAVFCEKCGKEVSE